MCFNRELERGQYSVFKRNVKEPRRGAGRFCTQMFWGCPHLFGMEAPAAFAANERYGMNRIKKIRSEVDGFLSVNSLPWQCVMNNCS